MSPAGAAVWYRRVRLRYGGWRLHSMGCPFAMFWGEAVAFPAGAPLPPGHVRCKACLG